MTVHAPPAARPLPGLADRESFFAAQARHRRASWKLAALCGLSVALLGLPIAMVVSPLLIGTAILVMDLLSLVAPAPDVLAGISALMERHGGPGGWVVIYLLVALPGIAVVLPTWMVAHRLLRRGGVGGVLLGLAARAPRADDLEEHQLENVLAEMALAAGVATPRLRLLDGPGTSAAAIGNDIADATVIVSRSLLDQLDRDQTQAIVGHLVASAGNGDLRIANLILSVHA
ncbi:MAG TPA: hypothetical protein VK348_09325, partial [Planctomycetota bacterium]|nr:hypothetical protein [Planctomycetota bacterium]